MIDRVGHAVEPVLSVDDRGNLPCLRILRNVRVCIKGECGYTTPSTLQPGAQATFRVPAKLERYVSGPDYRITWEVMPGRDE